MDDAPGRNASAIPYKILNKLQDATNYSRVSHFSNFFNF